MAFVESAKKVLKDWYGDNPKENPDLIRIINVNHFKRLTKLLDNSKGRIVHGGERDSEDLWISPTLVGKTYKFENIVETICISITIR